MMEKAPNNNVVYPVSGVHHVKFHQNSWASYLFGGWGGVGCGLGVGWDWGWWVGGGCVGGYACLLAVIVIMLGIVCIFNVFITIYQRRNPIGKLILDLSMSRIKRHSYLKYLVIFSDDVDGSVLRGSDSFGPRECQRRALVCIGFIIRHYKWE